MKNYPASKKLIPSNIQQGDSDSENIIRIEIKLNLSIGP